MTRRKATAYRGIDLVPSRRALGLVPHWKVRVVIAGGALLHLASRSEPVVSVDPVGRVLALCLEPVEGPGYGDTVGFMDWSAVTAITWRYSP